MPARRISWGRTFTLNRRALALWMLLALPLAAHAAGLSDRYAKWGSGPAKWLMTKDEQQAWSRIQSDDEAIHFIDLFWARRDPTPGTERNEFKEEFEQRVRYAERSFRHDKTPGALTDMGRFYILLGPPQELGADSGQGTAMSRHNESTLASMGQYAGSMGVVSRSIAQVRFTYPNWLQLGLAKTNLTFTEDPHSHEYTIDPQQGNPFGAVTRAIDKAIVNRDLQEVPAWALKGGLEPKRVVRLVIEPKKQPGVEKTLPAVAAGASRLTLLKDSQSIQPQGESDPFATLPSLDQFTRADDLGYAFQLCRSPMSEDSVKVTLKVTGETAKQKYSLTAPAEEMLPERIRTAANCAVVRGAIPLAEFEPAAYHLQVTVDDAGKIYELGKDFHVQ